MIMELLSILLGIILAGRISAHNSGFIIPLIDPVSLAVILVLVVPVLFRNGLGKDFIRAFKLLNKKYDCHLSELRRTLDVVEMMQKQIIWAGIIDMMVISIYILTNIDDLSLLGPTLAVVLVSLLYVAILELFLLPLQIEAKRRIINYMEEGQDA